MNLSTLTLLHASAALFLTGLIWTIQVVHYPLFALVGASGYREYQLAHQSRISLIVGPVMLAEAATTAALLLHRRDPVTIAGAILLAIIWLSTAFLQVPLHNQLSDGFNAAIHSRLVHTNWIRTVAWSLRAILALSLVRITE